MAVGVSDEIDEEELKTIAMNDTSHVFKVNQYKELAKILSALLKQSCQNGRCPYVLY